MPEPPPGRLLAAVSGGPDSTALLVWLVERGADVAAVHFDHALRPGSGAEAPAEAFDVLGLGVALVCGRRERPLERGSLQAAARAARYEFLEHALAETGRDAVCLGHTADDVVEGALLHLLRGSGLAGLRGMPERRGPFVRPLLGVWRAEIEAYLAARGIEPLRDPSNADVGRFARARVRHLILPRLERDRPGITARIRAAAATAARMQADLEAEARRLAGPGWAPLRALRQAPEAVRRETYRQLYGRQPALSRRLLEAMDRLVLAGPTGAGLDLPGDLRLRVEPDRVSLGVATLPPATVPRLRIQPCSGCDDTQATPVAHLRPGLDLAVGYRRPGLRMRPLGGAGTRKLQDILVDARVPRHLRDRLPLVFAGGRLAWVPGIAVDADAAAPAGAAALHVTLVGTPESLVVLSTSAHPRSPVT
jgi:tRNA(Ile)-lysidine synthetase-like protein